MFHSATDIAKFALAGNAILTLSSQKTGTHFTYRIQAIRNDDGKRNAKDAGLFFVAYLNGPDNGNDYAYLGVLTRRPEGVAFKTTAKSRAKDDAPVTQAFRYFHKHVFSQGDCPEALEVRHEGACGRCGRPLTVPTSIDSGFGPECASKMGG